MPITVTISFLSALRMSTVLTCKTGLHQILFEFHCPYNFMLSEMATIPYRVNYTVSVIQVI